MRVFLILEQQTGNDTVSSSIRTSDTKYLLCQHSWVAIAIDFKPIFSKLGLLICFYAYKASTLRQRQSNYTNSNRAFRVYLQINLLKGWATAPDRLLGSLTVR